MKPIKRTINAIVLCTGISSVVLQLITIRELLVRFQGNEFVIAMILFSWLALGGMGTFCAHRLTHRWFQPSLRRLINLSLVLALLSVLQIIGIRTGYDFIFLPGSSVGFYSTFLYVILALAPYCLLLGFLLPYSLFTLRIFLPHYSGAGIYLTDNMGDLAGGMVFSFALVFLVTPLTAVLIANLPLTAACFAAVSKSGTAGLKSITLGLTAIALLLMGVGLEKDTLTRPREELLYYRESRYGRIEIYQQHEMRTLYSDGVPRFTNQNRQLAEEVIHYPLSQIDRPRRLLVISGQGGMMAEIEKYRPASIDYVELDPQIIKAEFRYGLIQPVPGLHVHHQDGRAFLKASKKTYDAIILNVPEPDTFQLNRFFTDEFYGLIKNRLRKGGIFSFFMEGFENYLTEPQRKKLSITYTTVKRHFEHVLLLPGSKIFFLCRDLPLAADIPERLDRKAIDTQYIQSTFHGNVSPLRIRYVQELIQTNTVGNFDYQPRLLRVMFSQWFSKYASSPKAFAAVLLILTAAYLAFLSRESYLLFTTGFVNMGCEILVVFAFQIIFGYIYFQIGFIVTVFLAGLLPGAWLSRRMQAGVHRSLMTADILLGVLPGCFLLGIHWGNGDASVSFFMIFGFMVSLASGFQFPLALNLQGGSPSAVAQSFSADLTGAACGTLVTSLVLIPFMGITWAALTLTAIKASSLLVTGFRA
jgi:spermidine synthase